MEAATELVSAHPDLGGPAAVARVDGPVGAVTAGHERALDLLADKSSVEQTLAMYRARMGDVALYLRPTDAGLTVLSLDSQRCSSMISVGAANGGGLLKALPPSPAEVERAVADYEHKRDTLQRASAEERFVLGLMAGALRDRLRLAGTEWLFLHQEWRLTLPVGPGKVDLLAVDPRTGRVVVIECKKSAVAAEAKDRHGLDAAQQADAYAAVIWEHRRELYPFFERLLGAIAAVYAPGLGAVSLDPTGAPTTAVWWPDHTPPWPAWNAAELTVDSDDKRVARYRRHQSRYRERHLQVPPGPRPQSSSLRVGNTLDPASVAANPQLNFVNEAAYEHAIRRSLEVQQEGGSLEPDRLFHNLMSSMTMCFNLFGAIGAAPGFRDVVRALLDPAAVRIDDVVCEVKPTDALGDRTAFDALVRYRATDGGERFVGIETKYTEPFSQHEYDRETYRSVTEGCGWFVADAACALKGAMTNQLWRGLMLAALTEDATGTTGRYVVLTPADDQGARNSVDNVKSWLRDPRRLDLVTLEQVVEAARARRDDRLAAWAGTFERRYLP
jgi:hypothetical protein